MSENAKQQAQNVLSNLGMLLSDLESVCRSSSARTATRILAIAPGREQPVDDVVIADLTHHWFFFRAD